MAEEKGLTPRYVARIVDARARDVASEVSGELGWVERHMIRNHDREAVAQRSVTIRMENVVTQREELASQMDASLARTYRYAKETVRGMEPEDALDAAMIDYAQQRFIGTKEDYLGMQQAHTQELVNRAGTDIRKNIPPEPPPPPPAPVTVQRTGPKLRAARLFENGKTKYVIDD